MNNEIKHFQEPDQDLHVDVSIIIKTETDTFKIRSRDVPIAILQAWPKVYQILIFLTLVR